MDYQKVISRLKDLALESQLDNNLERWSRFEGAAETLEEWVNDGRKGKIPINLEELGIAENDEKYVETESEPSIEKADAPTTNAEKVNKRRKKRETEIRENKEQFVGEAPIIPNEVKDAKTIELANVITPEEQALVHQLDQVREFLQNKQFLPALNLSQEIVQRSTLPNLKDAAEDLHEKAKIELHVALQIELEAGEMALATDREAALVHFRRARELDPDNKQAKQALTQINQEKSAELSEKELRSLKIALFDRKDLKRLENAVHDAEALQVEGKLSEEMTLTLREAREGLDQIRIRHGQTTTQMRFGDLAARKQARDDIAEAVASNQKFYYDAATNEEYLAYELLQQANKLLEESSEDTANYVLQLVERQLPDHPKSAKEKLTNALEEPFYEKQKRILEQKLEEVERLVHQQEQAEKLDARSLEETDPIDVLKYCLQAYEVFPYIIGLESRLFQARVVANDSLIQSMQEQYNQAIIFFESSKTLQGEKRYLNNESIRKIIHQAIELSTRWPEKEKPASIEEMISRGKKLLQEIDDDEKLIREFGHRAEEIRQKVMDPSNRETGLKLFEELTADRRFAGLADLKTLVNELDQFRDISELLLELDDADIAGDWNRLEKLAEHILKSGKVGKFVAHVEEKKQKAFVELKILEVQEDLKQDEIDRAYSTLGGLIFNEKDPKKRAALKDRLTFEQEKIEVAYSNTRDMQDLYNLAMSLKDKNDFNSEILALRLFRYVGGDTRWRLEENWPEYKLSRLTADARRNERGLAAELRKKYLPAIKEVYMGRNKKQIDDQTLAALAETALSLRQALLIESSEREMVRWVECAWGKRQAEASEAAGNWPASLEIWKRLNVSFSHQPEIEKRLRAASIQQVIEQARALRRENKSEKSVEILNDALGAPLTANSFELHITMAEALLESDDYERALLAIDDAERVGAPGDLVTQKRIELRAQNAFLHGSSGAYEALAILQKAIGEGEIKEKGALEKMRDQIFSFKEDELIDQAHEEEKKSNDEGRINAVKALFELHKLEEIMQKKENERRSLPELAKLRTELGMVAEAIEREAGNFDPTMMELKDARAEVEKFFVRLDVFYQVAKSFGMNFGEIGNKVTARRREVGKLRDHLVALNDLLEKVASPSTWVSAVRLDDFAELDLIAKQVRKLELDDLEAAKGFYDKLSEWKDVHTFLSARIAEIKHQFEGEQDFELVISTIRQIAIRPEPQVRPTQRAWRFIHEPDYRLIQNEMSSKLRIMDIYNRVELVGWENVEKAAIESLGEREAWEKWAGEFSQLMDQAESAKNLTDRQITGQSLYEIRKLWTNLERLANAAFEKTSAGPKMDNRSVDDPVPIHSDKAKELSDTGKTALKIAESWLNKARACIKEVDDRIEIMGGFPEAEDFSKAVTQHDWERLKRLVDRARLIGPSDEQQERQLRVYENLIRTPPMKMPSDNPLVKFLDLIKNR